MPEKYSRNRLFLGNIEPEGCPIGVPNEETMEALREVENGDVLHFANFEEYKRYVNAL
ncbi:MAG: hypothetical protein LBO69_07595 [Ignavibacteria bacterium]|nr:hypothetical protein [Ignavibacteria bacterium]